MKPPPEPPFPGPDRPRFGGGGPPSDDWLTPGVAPLALERYLRVLRERWLVIAMCVAAAIAGVAIYLITASKVYEAEADMLVSPAPREGEGLLGLGLIRESSDPTRDVETVARLVTSSAVARQAQATLRTDRTPRALLNNVTAEPVAQSNIVAITARGSTAREAQQLANAFGRAIVSDRTQQLHSRIDRAIAGLQVQRAAPQNQTPAALAAIDLQINDLQTLRAGPDPTIRLENAAELPTSPVAPRPLFATGASLLVALVLGLAGAFALDMLDPRLRREEQLRHLTRLPVLARIPREPGGSTPLRPERLSPRTIEAYRTLRATLSASRGRNAGPRSILVTGASASEGKTTTAINLAASLAYAGHRVILVEADLRRPAIGKTLDVEPTYDLMDVVLEEVSLEDALVTTGEYGPNLLLLLARAAEDGSTAVADGLFLPTAQALGDHAKRLADFVIIDSPPLIEVIDGLALAERADQVLLVTRLGHSHISRIQQLGELLARHGIAPVGFVIVGVPASETASEYYAPGPSSARSRALARS